MGDLVSKYAFYPPQGERVIEEEVLTLVTRFKNTIPAIHIKYLEPNHTGLTILYSHGNAEDLQTSSELMSILSSDLRSDVFAYDYSGYSLSTDQNGQRPTPCEKYAYADIDAAFEYLKGIGIPPEKIILFGKSIGTGPTTDLASRDVGVSGVILQSPLMSAVRVVMNTPLTLPIDIFVNISKINKIRCPVFIIHGTLDEVINIQHGRELHSLLRNPYPAWWIKGAGHNDIEARFYGDFINHISEFLKNTQVTPPLPQTQRGFFTSFSTFS